MSTRFSRDIKIAYRINSVGHFVPDCSQIPENYFFSAGAAGAASGAAGALAEDIVDCVVVVVVVVCSPAGAGASSFFLQPAAKARARARHSAKEISFFILKYHLFPFLITICCA
jgi:hypothetical protein